MNQKKEFNMKNQVDSTVVPIPVLVDNLEKSQGAIVFVKGTVNQFPEIKDIKVGDLTIDPKFQRLLDKRAITKAKHLDLELFQCVVVFKRPDGTLIVVDGQHKTVMAFKGMNEDFKVPCQVITHDKNMTLKQCQVKEAKTFEKLNFNRKNVSRLAKIRAGLAYGDSEAEEFEAKFVTMGIFKEGIGDVKLGVEIFGTAKAETAFDKFKGTNTKLAVDYLRTDKDGKPLSAVNGSMVFALASIFNLLDALGEGTLKYVGLANFLNKFLKNRPISKWTKNCAGNLDYVVIARRIIEASNDRIADGDYDGSAVGDKVLESNYLGALETR
jgi:hypothetical protein